jgi:hypothetical protein
MKQLKNLACILSMASLTLVANNSYADQESEGICVKTIKTECIVSPKNDCQGKRGKRGFKGKKGDPGEKGDKGERGEQGDTGLLEVTHFKTEVVREHHVHDGISGIGLTLGYTGYAAWPDHEYVWAHGPSLQLNLPIKPGRYATLEGTWAPGRKDGLIGRFSGTEMLDDQFGLSLGVVGLDVGRADDADRGTLVLATPSLVVHEELPLDLFLRAEGGLLVGASEFGDDWDLVGGVFGSVSLGTGW